MESQAYTIGELRMGMIRFRFIMVVVFMLCACFPLLAVSATYTPESPIYLKKSPGIFTNATVFGAKLGRLTITSSAPMYNPTILVTGLTGGYNIVMIGPHRWSLQNQWTFEKEINMNLLTVSYPNGLGGSVFIRAIKDKQPLLQGWSGEQVTTSPFYVDIYLVNMNDYGGTSNTNIAANLNTDGGFFKLDSPYTFKYPFNPHFTVGITNTINQGPYVFPAAGNPTQGEFIPIDGVVGQGTTPVIDPSGYTSGDDEDEGFWYGDGYPQPVNYLFSLLHDSVSFALTDAYGSNKKVINTATMNVQNGAAGQLYSRNLIFTVAGTANSFQLKPVIGEGYGIDFDLYFGNGLVDYGIPTLWGNLTPGINSQSLSIGGIDENQVRQRSSGDYQATIIITITTNT